MRKIFGLFLILLLAAAGWLAWSLLAPVGPSGQAFVMLRPGYSTRRIASELKAAGVIRSEEALSLALRVGGRGWLGISSAISGTKQNRKQQQRKRRDP